LSLRVLIKSLTLDAEGILKDPTGDDILLAVVFLAETGVVNPEPEAGKLRTGVEGLSGAETRDDSC